MPSETNVNLLIALLVEKMFTQNGEISVYLTMYGECKASHPQSLVVWTKVMLINNAENLTILL